MKRAFKFIIPFVAFFIMLSSFTTNPVKKDPDKDKVLTTNKAKSIAKIVKFLNMFLTNLLKV